MAGDGVLFKWDDKDLQAMIARSIGNIKDMTPVMKSFSEYMVTQTDKRFMDEKAPDGSPWQKLSSITLARKARLNKIDKILQQDGYLRLVHPHADKDSAGVYSDRIYTAIHNRGGMAGPGRKVKIPKREFLGFNDEDFKEFEETCKDFIILGRRP
jgi:phage virion morphogenesis protein